MKIIDQTPFFKENGEISTTDRARAFMKYGKSWLNEMDAQRTVLAVLDKTLDKKFTLLRNITLPGLDTPIPFILVGPTGIYVMYVTPVLGMFRAKGDQWGTISGNAFKPDKTNLLTRTERMARSVQVYLQRQGYIDLGAIEAILLCSNPGVHVDSLRPIVRIVMRDALERFAISILQARVALNPDMVNNVVNLITTPPAPKEETSAPEVETLPPAAVEEAAVMGAATAVPAFIPLEGEIVPASVFAEAEGQAPALPVAESAPPRKKRGITRKQWLFLALMMLLWCLMVAVFIYFVVKDLYL